MGVSVPAAIRPDDWDLALFVHVLGAMLLVGALVLGATYLFTAWREDAARTLRFAFRALLYGAIPGYIVMRAGAEWAFAKEGLDEAPEDPSWIGIGYGVADIGLLLLLIATVTTGVAARRAASGGSASVLGVRIATGLVALLIFADVIAIWAMTTKPA